MPTVLKTWATFWSRPISRPSPGSVSFCLSLFSTPFSTEFSPVLPLVKPSLYYYLDRPGKQSNTANNSQIE